ncbi:MAG: HD domain-containing protein [Candidatus Omnitrophica bacterium]|nr:HD domain-containing protein [Candidatus Omnitrophota bacterium]
MEIKHLPKDGKDEFLRRLAERLDFKKVRSAFSKYVGSFTMWITDEKLSNKDDIKSQLCATGKFNEQNKKICFSNIDAAIKEAKGIRATKVFLCAFGHHGFCIPIIADDEVIGYIFACYLRSMPDKDTIELFNYIVKTATDNIQKEIKLEGLQKTVKLRSVALSTVHTIHRLITSSFYLNDLLSRIARLSMQIIKANRCSVKLIDSKRKTLLPKITVDLRTKKTKLKKVKIGRWAPGKAYKYGKSFRDAKYLAVPLIDESVIGVITLYDKTDNQPFDEFDEEIMKTLAEQAAVAIKNAQLYKEQEKLTMGSIKALARIIESKGSLIYTPKTSFLKLVQFMGQEFKMREQELKTLQYATLLHDAGELMVPEKVLRKRGRLTEHEYKLIKEHPLQGAKIIKSLKSLKSIAPIIMYHHENYDGTGYPKGLAGNEIPVGARIMAVVSAFEAMIAKRPYRKSLSIDEATEEIKKNSGKQFDPKAVEAFLKILRRKDATKLIKSEMHISKKRRKS